MMDNNSLWTEADARACTTGKGLTLKHVQQLIKGQCTDPQYRGIPALGIRCPEEELDNLHTLVPLLESLGYEARVSKPRPLQPPTYLRGYDEPLAYVTLEIIWSN